MKREQVLGLRTDYNPSGLIYGETLTAYEQAISLDPNNTDAYVVREDALKQVRRWNKK